MNLLVKKHWKRSKKKKLVKYYSPEEFKLIEDMAWDLGFKMVSCSPLTRSSYHADEHFSMLRKANA